MVGTNHQHGRLRNIEPGADSASRSQRKDSLSGPREAVCWLCIGLAIAAVQAEASKFMNLTPYVVLWSFLGVAVLALAAYRKIMMLHQEDEAIHLGAGEEKQIPRQLALAHKLEVLDRWGKSLTVVTVLSGLLVAVIYLYGVLEQRG